MIATRNQSRVSISGLTYNNLLEDAYNALKDSDAFKNNFTDFTSNTAERMIVELYAYVATQLANRLDQMGNELFVDTASASGMSRLLKLVGAKIDFPSAASVDVDVTTSSNTNAVYLTTGIDADNGTELNFVSGSFKSVTANNGTNWEFIDYKVGDNGEYVYDYTTEYKFNAPQETFSVHEGTTQSLEYTIRSTDIDIVTLPGSPVIKNSVRVYYKQKVTKKGTTNKIEIAEFKKVENFFTTDALTAKTGVFTERNLGNGRCELCLKPYYKEGDENSDLGKELLIMYRIGGGEDGNISIGAIDKAERFGLTDANGRITSYGLLNIYNSSTGAGGKDELTTDEIRATVLQEVRNTKIAVTEEDYEYLLPKYDSEIELIKCYGEKNSEIANLAETYGYYVNPITVWLIILKYNKEFYDAYLEGVSGLTDRINDISFSTLDVNPRFNEKYQINKASLNQVFSGAELSQFLSNGVYSFEIDKEGVDILTGKDASITVTNYPYIESSLSTRRGVNCFRRYDTTSLKGTKTWAELKALQTAAKNDVYIITDADYYGEVDNRWECTQDYSGVTITDANVLTYWKKVDFAYVYDNLVSDDVSEDRLYIKQSSSSADSFSPVYSYIDDSFSGDWESFRTESGWVYGDNGIQIPAGTNVYITINGIQILIEGGQIFADGAAFAEFLSAKASPETNVIFLKQRVTASLDEQPRSVVLPTQGISSVTFTLVTGGTTSNVTMNVTGLTTYGDLIDALDSNLPAAYKAVWIEENQCFNLGIICATTFTYRDSSESLANDSALYVNLLDNTEPDAWPLVSSVLQLTAAQANDFASYLSEDITKPIATYDPNTGMVKLGFDKDGECSLQVASTNSVAAGLFRNLFGLNSQTSDATTVNNRRILTILYSEDDNGSAKAYLQISMASSEDKLPANDLYINIFGARNKEIRLGEYYENIENYLTDVSSVVTDLLKRDPITHLYSTNYITDNYENAEDKYGSDYQLKLSTGLIEEQTFNQLSSGNSPAEVITMNTSLTSMPFYENDDKLYIKVDNVDYDGSGDFTANETQHTVPEENGYAVFNLSWFNGCTTNDFVNAIINVFKEQGAEYSPLLQKIITEANTLKIYTLSSTFYSSIDFGKTLPSTISTLFTTDASVVHSREGQIDASQIRYKYYPITNALVVGETLNIQITPSGSSSVISSDINIGYSIIDFTNNVADSAVKDYVLIDNNRIILKDLTNGTKIKVTVAWSDNVHKLSWENMFTSNIWDQFTQTGDDSNGTAYLEFVNEGDYYIDVRDDGYYFVVENEDVFPYGDIYFHMYEDYSNDHVVKVVDNNVIYTDEYNWNNLMSDRKVMLTEHVYKQPRFIPFDLALTCYLPNTEAYSQIDYPTEITNYLRIEYGLYSNNIGQEILPDDIVFNVKENFSKILKVTVDYLGYDLTNAATNQESLTTEFNQKHILASTYSTTGTVVDPDTGFITVQDEVIVHGLKLSFKYRAY